MGCSCAAPGAKRPPACRWAFSRRFPWWAQRLQPRRYLEPRSPVLLGWCVQNGLQKRIKTPERYFPFGPVVRSVAEDVEQLFARFLVELGVGRNLLQHHDEAGLRTRFMPRVRHAVI